MAVVVVADLLAAIETAYPDIAWGESGAGIVGKGQPTGGAERRIGALVPACATPGQIDTHGILLVHVKTAALAGTALLFLVAPACRIAPSAEHLAYLARQSHQVAPLP
jgi:hypothetical protein